MDKYYNKNNKIKDIPKLFEMGMKDIYFSSVREGQQDIIEEILALDYQSMFIPTDGSIKVFICKNVEALTRLIGSDVYKDMVAGEPLIHHKELGILLGFPPGAASRFGKVDAEKSFGVHYCGLVFASYEETLLDDIIWLLTHKPPTENNAIDLIIDKFKHNHVVEFVEMLRFKPITTSSNADEILDAIKETFLKGE